MENKQATKWDIETAIVWIFAAVAIVVTSLLYALIWAWEAWKKALLE